MAQYTILSTKKLDPRLKAAMAEKGVEVMEEEFISIRPIITHQKYQEIWPWISNPADTAVLFTSQHAVTTIDKYLHGGDAYYIPDHWNVFCLNGATRERVQEMLSEEQILNTAPNATELAARIIAHGQYKRIVFFCGNLHLDTLPRLLTAAGIEVVEIVVYETVATPVVTTAHLDAILFFSPSGVKSFFSANTLARNTMCFAIGDTTAASISEHTGNKVITSEAPTQETMLASVWLYLQNIDLYK